jgi:hypothetical protein
VTLSADLTEMAITTGRIYEEVPEAKDRLGEAVESQLSARGTVYRLIAPTAVRAFIIHAEGNENENDDSYETLSILENAAEYGKAFVGEEKAQQLLALANSMLQDKSQYGTDREDQTNDLTLSIKLAEGSSMMGDVNGDNAVNVADIVEIINFMNDQASEHFNEQVADITGEGDVNQEDINALLFLIMTPY